MESPWSSPVCATNYPSDIGPVPGLLLLSIEWGSNCPWLGGYIILGLLGLRYTVRSFGSSVQHMTSYNHFISLFSNNENHHAGRLVDRRVQIGETCSVDRGEEAYWE